MAPSEREREPRLSMDMSNAMQMEQIGYVPEYSMVANQRRKLRDIMDSLVFESIVIFIVMVYLVILFAQMMGTGVTGPDPLKCVTAGPNPAAVLITNASLDDECELSEPRDALYYLDLIFLAIFLFEFSLRLLGYGFSIFKDPVQTIDFCVVTIAFISALLPPEATAGMGNLVNMLRVVRIFRIAIVLQRLQRSRDAAAMRRKRAMYRRLGAPVEKVLAFLTDLRNRISSQRDQYNIEWMMEVIASDELYSVAAFDEDTLQQSAGAAGAGDMSRYLSSETGLARRRAGSFESDGEHEDGEGEAGAGKKDGGGGAGAGGDGGVVGKRKLSDATLQLWAGAAIATSGLSVKLQKLVSPEAWSFDVFEYDLACAALPEPGTGKSATLLCYYLLEQHGVLDAMAIERPKMLAWLTRIDEAYSRDNPYHNALHAADVCANVDYFIRQPNLSRHLTHIDRLSALVAAIIHDMGHPGVNNTFLEATKHELAILYNDVSVLENHHVAAAFKLLKTKELDWTKTMALEDYKDFRETVVGMVLGTDMRAHFEHLTKFKSKLAGDGFADPSRMERKDTRLLLTMALHAADIANPAKPVPMATAWARRSMEEFFRQGDREAELGQPVSPFMDRTKVPLAATIVNCQIGFINVLVRPLLSEWASFLGAEAERDVVVTLEATLRLWETSGAKVVDSWGDFATLKPGGADAKTDGAGAGAGGKSGKDLKKDKDKDPRKTADRGGPAGGESSSRPIQQRM